MKSLDTLYKGINLKKPIEMEDYEEKSEFAVKQIETIIQKKLMMVKTKSQ